MPRPVKMQPRLVERVWGVHDLHPWFDHQRLDKPIGEVWFTALDNKTEDGIALDKLLASGREEWMGSPAMQEVLLLKFIFTNERLSVQVHPDDEFARRHENSLGKTEAWYILSSSPGGKLGLGLRRSVTIEETREAALSGAIEELIDWRKVSSGECWLVPAGTIHAIGAGLAVVEVQENSDITYRLYDYGRPRELHLERGLQVSKLAPYDVESGRRVIERGREVVVECSHFTMEHWSSVERLRFEGPARHYHLAVVTAGRGTLDGRPFGPGEVFLVPANCAEFAISSDGAEFLIAYSAPGPTAHFARA